jgi:hypothetical protein
MKKIAILTVAIILSGTVASRSKTSAFQAKKNDFPAATFSAKSFLATAD